MRLRCEEALLANERTTRGGWRVDFPIIIALIACSQKCNLFRCHAVRRDKRLVDQFSRSFSSSSVMGLFLKKCGWLLRLPHDRHPLLQPTDSLR